MRFGYRCSSMERRGRGGHSTCGPLGRFTTELAQTGGDKKNSME